MKRFLLSVMLMCGLTPIHAQIYDTVTVLFPMNDAKLSKQAMNYIDSLIFHDVLIHGQIFTVIGYTDYVGGKTYNEALSRQRAKNVMDYLMEMGFEQKDITMCLGKGKIESPPVNGKEGIASDRRVQIVIDGNPPPKPVTLAPMAAPAVQPTAKAGKAGKNTTEKLPPPPPKITHIDLTSVSLNQAISLKDLHFEGDRHVILPESQGELDTLYKLMKENYMVRIQIEGHICCPVPNGGTDTKDADNGGWLSEERAKAVYDYLAERGIQPSRMKYKGFGYTRPLVKPELTEADRIRNRRVEIRITSK